MRNQKYESVGVFTPEFVFSIIPSSVPSKIFDKREYDIQVQGYKVNVASLRYQVFRKSLKCCLCGLEGKFFVLEKSIAEKNSKRFHFNLYALDYKNNPILMTKDHIIPVSKGGTDHISNLRTMCFECNQLRGNS